jgi:hypothetical protein
MRDARFRFIGWSTVFVIAGALGACQSGGSSGPASAVAAPRVKVDPSKVQARAKTPPPATAVPKTSIGSGKVSMKTANSPADQDSFWIEEIDIDGDGVVERTEMLWDDEDRVLYAYAQTDVDCAAGGIAVVAVLVGVNADGNPRKRQPGSGMIAAEFDETECGASEAGLYGCTFNGAGIVTNWVVVRLDEENDTVMTADTFR